jgi:hypothetical protein
VKRSSGTAARRCPREDCCCEMASSDNADSVSAFGRPGRRSPRSRRSVSMAKMFAVAVGTHHKTDRCQHDRGGPGRLRSGPIRHPLGASAC